LKAACCIDANHLHATENEEGWASASSQQCTT